MPYEVRRNHDGCNGWAVVSTTSGKTHGCHETKEKARAQQRALYRNAPESAETEAMSEDGGTVKVMDSTGGNNYFIFGPATATDWMMSTSTTADNFTVVASPEMEETEETEEVESSDVIWEGILGIEGKPTDDRRYLMPGEIIERDLPLSLMVQTITDEGHKGAQLGGKITEIWRKEDEDGAIEIWGRGPFDSSEFGQEAARLVEEEFLTGVSLDLAISEAVALDPETFEPMDMEDFDLTMLMNADFVTGIKGTIMGATLVPFQAFADAKVAVVTASGNMKVERPRVLVAAAGPLKPPREWFEDPHLTELTPLQIRKDGRVYGHLADWDGCHVGFQGVCVPPFRSASNYAYFNVGQIETAEGDLVPCGKIMFCRDGDGHAPIGMSADEASRYYDDATKVGAFVRAGSDRFGTWLAGALRSDLDDLEIQHLRTHPPSGDWRPVKGGPSELIAAFAVPIPGFPISRMDRALVASANGEITAIITAPLTISPRKRMRKMAMLKQRFNAVLARTPKPQELTPAERRKLAMEWPDTMAYNAEQRRRMAKNGQALPDGSFPIANCADAQRAIRAQGRATNQARAVAHIKKRVRALSCSGDIFDDYR